jgi:hypothetical protein
LSLLDGIQLDFSEVEELAHSRIDSYRGHPVKSAVLATNPLAFGIARMYEQLMRRSPIEIYVFTELDDGAAWLGLPAECLTADA